MRYLFILCMLGFSLQTFAQRITVTGTVTDENDEPVTGANVVVKGTTIGTISNVDGYYSISFDLSNRSTLVVSFLGYRSQEIPVRSQRVVHVKLEPDMTLLDDVVVIGYGTVRRQDVAGSVGSPNMAEVLKAPVASVDEALAGRVAGVQVTSTEGQPGSNINILIRGANSITQSNSPLFVVDGFPLEDFNFNTLNPSDIKSMDVLKDASATAIYGARGANGVIIIQTNSGTAGKTRITYEGSYGWQNVISKMDMLSPYDFVLLQKEVNNELFRSHYLKPDGQGRETRTIDYYKNVPYIDWQEMAFQNAALTNHSLSVSGGSKDTQFSLSFGYMRQEGVVITSGFERFTGRMRLDHFINPNLKVGLNASYAQTKSFGATVRGASMGFTADLTAMYNIWGYRPFSGDKTIEEYLQDDIDDEIHGTTAGNRVNPITTLKTEERSYINYDFIANAYVEYKFLKDFTFMATGGINRRHQQNEIYYGPGHPATMLAGGSVKGINGSAQYPISTRLLNENTLTYQRVFDKVHSVTALVGFTAETYKYSNFKGEAWNISRNLGISALDEGEAQPLISRKTENSRLSYLGRVQYNYDSRYYLTASFRSDGSSKFPSGNKFSSFPSAAIMWRASNEQFLKENKYVSDLRLRASYGLTGNDRVGDSDYLPVLTISSVKGYSWNNNTPTYGAESTQIGNTQLKWETTETYDLGLDLGLFDQRIEIMVDLYRKKTRDLLLNAKQPTSSGYTQAMMNIGSVQNKGIEITLNTVNIHNKKFMWTSNFNIAFNRSKVLSLADGESYLETTVNWSGAYSGQPLYIAEVGKPIAMFQGMKWLGNYQISDFTWQNNSDPTIPHSDRNYELKEDVPTNGLARNQIKPGYIKYQDMTNLEEGTIDSDDRVVIGDPNPKFTGGFSNTFVYKDFDLNVFFQFSYGNEIMNVNRLIFEGTYRYGLNQFASYADRWSPENYDSPNHVPGGGGNTYYSDKTIEDGSFLRLKTLQVGYTLPGRIVNKWGISKLRCYVAGQNLITWTRYSGFDPEVSISATALTPGLDYLSYPRARTYTFGLNVTF